MSEGRADEYTGSVFGDGLAGKQGKILGEDVLRGDRLGDGAGKCLLAVSARIYSLGRS
jgi:hypothetical protein